MTQTGWIENLYKPVSLSISSSSRECYTACSSSEAGALAMTFWICPTVPMDLLDAELEVAVEVLTELLDFRPGGLLLLTVDAGFVPEVEVEVD